MYAIIEDGSRQYRVEPNGSVVIDYREVEIGATIELTKVLLLHAGDVATVGRPLVEGVRVVGVVTELPTKKTVIQHFRRRKNSKRLKGHTQSYIRVKIQHILKPGEQPPAETPKAETPAPSPTA